MKPKLTATVLLVLFVLASGFVKANIISYPANDTAWAEIILKNGDTLEAKIVSIDKKFVKYKTDPENTFVFKKRKNKIYKISYPNGTEKIISTSKSRLVLGLILALGIYATIFYLSFGTLLAIFLSPFVLFFNFLTINEIYKTRQKGFLWAVLSVVLSLVNFVMLFFIFLLITCLSMIVF